MRERRLIRHKRVQSLGTARTSTPDIYLTTQMYEGTTHPKPDPDRNFPRGVAWGVALSLPLWFGAVAVIRWVWL